MVSLGYILCGAVALMSLNSCTGESIRITVPDRHPASPAAAEAPFSLPSDPLASVGDSAPSPAPQEPATPHHGPSSHDRHEKPH